jgi:hypothetical protein
LFEFGFDEEECSILWHGMIDVFEATKPGCNPRISEEAV